MPNYTDNRIRYKYASPADMPAGNARWDNPLKREPRCEPAIASSTRPRDAFRVSSAPKPLEPEPMPEPIQIGEPIPEESTWEL